MRKILLFSLLLTMLGCGSDDYSVSQSGRECLSCSDDYNVITNEFDTVCTSYTVEAGGLCV